MKVLPVSEIFGPTIQGEGYLAGHKTLFVRLMGCDFGCSWCDTRYTWAKGELGESTLMEPAQIDEALVRLSGVRSGQRLWVTISGGNPALHDLAPLIGSLHQESRFRVALETQGSRYQEWMEQLDLLTVSPKGPSSDMQTDWDVLRQVLSLPSAVAKVVVFTDEDYAYAKAVYRQVMAIDPTRPFYLQVGTLQAFKADENAMIRQILDSYRQLVERVTVDPDFDNVAVLPQLHTLLWGAKRGV